MKLTAQEKLSNILIDLEKKAFNAETPDALVIEDIYNLLRKLSKSDRSNYKEFFERINNKLFHSGVKVKGLPEDFFNSIISQNIKNPEDEIIEYVSKESDENINFNLSEFVKKQFDLLSSLRDFYILVLTSEYTEAYQTILLHDDHSNIQSLEKHFTKNYSGIKSISIKDWNFHISNKQTIDSNFNVFLFISSTQNNSETLADIKNILKNTFEIFKSCAHCKIKFDESKKLIHLVHNSDTNDFFDILSTDTSITLLNSELSYDEENLIKSLFKTTGSKILDYKILKSGKSGAKVFEIRPLKNYSSSSSKRFVVKFGKVDEKNKIRLEANRFGSHVESYSIKDDPLTKQYERNTNFEGIKYTYASKDNIRESFSFSQIISNLENPYFMNVNSIIEELFKHPLFGVWDDSIKTEHRKICDLYQDYINIERLYKDIRKIKCIKESEQDQFIEIFKTILEHKIETNVKVCHGDLHTENFFHDGEGIYLIDFGFTDNRHALLDHASLECSIKFKHIPFYINQSILLECESELLRDDSFNSNLTFPSKRTDLALYFGMIKIIRENSKKYFFRKSDNLEYFISLFIMTSRQIQYPDLNQLYALNSAETLGNFILSKF